MEETAQNKLLAQVKRKCKITWSEQETDLYLSDIMDRANAVLRDKIGIDDDTFDFSKPGRENLLFVAFCYYAYHDSEDLFEPSYAPEIAQARRHWEVKLDDDTDEKE